MSYDVCEGYWYEESEEDGMDEGGLVAMSIQPEG